MIAINSCLVLVLFNKKQKISKETWLEETESPFQPGILKVTLIFMFYTLV